MKRHPTVTEGRSKGVEKCAHAQPEVAQYLPLWGLFTGSASWGGLSDVRVYHCLALVIYPFYFHIIFQYLYCDMYLLINY